jgi:integrase
MLSTAPENTQISPSEQLAQAGLIANAIASQAVFTDYRSRKAANTLTRQDGDLALFATFLRSMNLTPGELATDPAAWHGITWGLVGGFARWQLAQGYAVSSVNIRLSTVKTYAKLAAQSGSLDITEIALICAVQGYSRAQTKRIDENRESIQTPTRRGNKKVDAVSLTRKQAKSLKTRPNTPQGRRDALLMCLLLDHGLRCGEIADLNVSDFDLNAGELRFYRAKVNKTQTHRLSPDTLKAARAYFNGDAPQQGPVLRSSRRGGILEEAGMTERAITKRVAYLGESISVLGLSAHDCRHYWATQAARSKTPIDRLQDAGGWASPAMPLRYIEAAKIANEGVKLGEDE